MPDFFKDPSLSGKYKNIFNVCLNIMICTINENRIKIEN